MTAIVYRQLPDIPHRQYVRRIVAGYWLLWHRDKAMALVFERDEAKRLADVLWMRSRPGERQERYAAATEPQGEYGTEEVLP